MPSPSKHNPWNLETRNIPYGELCQEHFENNGDLYVLRGMKVWYDENNLYHEVIQYREVSAYHKLFYSSVPNQKMMWDAIPLYEMPSEELYHGICTKENPFGF